MRIQRVAKTFARRNAKTSKHRIPLTPLWFDHSKANSQTLKVLYQCSTFSHSFARSQSAMPVLEIGMVFTHQGQPAMKSTTYLALKWRLLARVARPCLSSASHFFGLRISPSCSEIFNRRRISIRSSCSVKFLGRHGKIEVFEFIFPLNFATS